MSEVSPVASYVPVQDFYTGKDVFVTGATGFLGKVLIEKLLYSCRGIHTIYVLLRDKKNVSADERLKKLLSSPIFTRVRDEDPGIMEKIKLVIGDLTSHNLGFNLTQEVMLQNVSVVFHLAATVRFDEPLKTATLVNVEGTREVMKVIRKFKNLELPDHTMSEVSPVASYVPVQDFYTGKDVFVTGATGFLGKVLIEKLLYSCRGIHTIYVLLRDKKNVSADERLKKLLSSPIFTRVRDEDPGIMEKIKLVIGDLTSHNLGFNLTQEVMLQNVSVVFHLAATVRFDEPLKTATLVNVEGTREVMKVIRKFKNLELPDHTMSEVSPVASYVPVQDFYTGKDVFVTGATGFLGKVLIEKLLYSCRGIHTIYVLLRDKKNVSADERLKKLLSSPIFTRVRDEDPGIMEKIKLVIGDLTSHNLGFNLTQEVMLQNVSVVFHLAATVRFDEPLKTATLVNVEGTREVMKVIRKFKNLEAFVYVSTAFSNPHNTVIEEVIYPPPRSFEEVYETVKNDEYTNNVANFLNGWPNTYTFTKALAENVIAVEQGDLPSIIVRPSIVTPAAAEPLRGWVDNWLGITFFIFSCVKGWLHVLYGKRKFVIDIIPVDYVVNLIIVAAARYKRSEDFPVYNICSSSSNPITYDLLGNILMRESAKEKFNDFPLLGIYYTLSEKVVAIISFIFEIIPAYLADIWINVTGRRNSSTSFVSILSKQSIMREKMRYFHSRTWMIDSARTSKLYADLQEPDIQTFPCEASHLKWTEYIPTYFYGIRQYLLNSRK